MTSVVINPRSRKLKNLPARRIVANRPKETGSISAISFFSGCGGLDLGFLGGFTYKGETLDRLPYEIIAAYDNDIPCIETYRHNIDDNIHEIDLGSADVTLMPSAEVLIGGFPCQDFSSCGPKRGLESERGKLYQALIRYMKVHRPLVVIAENVPHLERMRKGEILKTILLDFENTEYNFDVWRLSAPEYGVPQNRRRLFFVGVRKDIAAINIPIQPQKTHEGAPRTIEWAIGDLISITDESIPNQSQYFKANKAKRGNGQGDETNKLGLPAYTVRANAKSRVHFHYELDRRLTIRECARIQTFPDNFDFPHSTTTNIMQIGNAVPPLLAYRVAESIASYLIPIKRGMKNDKER